MKVSIKDFKVEMDVKTNGIEFEIRDPSGDFRGDCFVTMKGLIWCEGKKSRENGVNVTWNEFIDWMKKGKSTG
jgi:hypothetical protein